MNKSKEWNLSPPNPSLPPSLFFVSSLTAAVFVVLIDLAFAVQQSSENPPAFLLIKLFVWSLGVVCLPAILLSIGLSIFSYSCRGLIDPKRVFSFLKTTLSDSERDRRVFAWVLSITLAILTLGAFVYGFLRFYAIEMQNKRNTILSTALVTVALVPILATFLPPFYQFFLWISRIIPKPKALLSLVLILLASIGVFLFALFSVEWRIIHFGPWKILATFIGFFITTFILLKGVSRSKFVYSLGITLGLSSILCVAVTFTNHGWNAQASIILNKHTQALGSLFQIAGSFFDQDRDGYKTAFTSDIDCNDRNPKINIEAYDYPGNGIDEDCDGQDSFKAEKPDENQPIETVLTSTLPTWKGNWLIITIDTLRSDQIDPAITPNMASLTEQGIAFKNVYAQAPNTPRSFPSFLTSRMPSQVHFTNPTANFSSVTGEDPTLFSVFAEHGYRVFGIFSHFYLEKERGLSTGFLEWNNQGATNLHDSNHDIASPRITNAIIKKFHELSEEQRNRNNLKPFVLWTHLFDPHSTYMEHPEFPLKNNRDLKEKYKGEVKYTDRYIGLIMEALKTSGLAETTAVVIFSDHGESLGERSFRGERLFFHGETLYNEVLKVPLIIMIPSKEFVRRVVNEPAMLIDLPPTILSMSGIATPPTFQGESLLRTIDVNTTEVSSRRPIYAEMLPCKSWNKNERVMIKGNFKLYKKYTDGVSELYNLEEDPTEQKNLATSMPEKTKELEKELLRYQHSLLGPSER